MSNVIFMVNISDSRKPGRNDPYQFSINSWRHYCKRHGHEFFLLTERIHPEDYMNANWHKLFAFQLLDGEGVEYDRIMIVDGDTIIHPDAPDIFAESDPESFCAVHNDGSYDWLLRSIEVYSKELFNGRTIHFPHYFNSGVLIVNKMHKYFFNSVLNFYKQKADKIREIQEKYHVGTDQPVLNFLSNSKLGTPYQILSYKWNMQDMCRKEILDTELTFTKFGWLYHFNAIPSNYKLRDDNSTPVYQWMKYTYERLYG